MKLNILMPIFIVVLRPFSLIAMEENFYIGGNIDVFKPCDIHIQGHSHSCNEGYDEIHTTEYEFKSLEESAALSPSVWGHAFAFPSGEVYSTRSAVLAVE